MSTDQPVAAIWRTQWLPASETFVANHVASLSRYRPLTLGLRRLDEGYAIVPDRAPLPGGTLGRRLEGLSRRTGYLGLHDDLLRRQHPALVHAHFGPDAVEVLPIVRRHRLPLAVTFHGYDVQSAPRTMPRYRRLLPELFEAADLLLPVSDFLAEQLVELGAPREKVRTHYLGIPVGGAEAASPLPRRALRTADEAMPGGQQQREGIVLVGRLVEAKGLDQLVDVLLALPEHLRGVPVTLVGGGPLEDELRSQAAAHPELDIRFAGWQRPDEVARSMASAQVFCMLSRPTPQGVAESFGLVALEAALAATPVVTYACGGLPEAVSDGVSGLVAPVGDVDGYAERLASLLDDQARARRLGVAGRERVLADFDVRTQTGRLEELYDTIAR